MIYPDVSLTKWIAKWGLKVESAKCSRCGKTVRTTVPILSKDYAGLESPVHGCGPRFTTVTMTPRSKESIESWDEIFAGIKSLHEK